MQNSKAVKSAIVHGSVAVATLALLAAAFVTFDTSTAMATPAIAKEQTVHDLSYWFAAQQVQSERCRQEGDAKVTEARTFAPRFGGELRSSRQNWAGAARRPRF